MTKGSTGGDTVKALWQGLLKVLRDGRRVSALCELLWPSGSARHPAAGVLHTMHFIACEICSMCEILAEILVHNAYLVRSADPTGTQVQFGSNDTRLGGMSDRISTADLYDERGEELQSVSTQFLNLGGNTQFVGPVRTVRCHRDNALLKSILGTPGEGAVLVVDGGGALESALVGDIIAQLGVDNGWAGIVVHGVIRDRVVIGTLPIGLKALGSNPQKSSKTGAGEADVPVSFGGVTFRPGAMLFSDEDGILVEH